MTTLVTGFDAYGSARVNSSQLVVEALAKLGLDTVVTAVLPTSYRKSENRLLELIRSHRPDRVLMLGLDDCAIGVVLEQAALNLDDSPSPDNDGEVRLQQRIAEDAPVGYWTSLPLKRMADIARQLGQGVDYSHDAGGYVCNHVFFTAAHAIEAELSNSTCGFVHLPPISGPGETLDRIVELVQAWIGDNG